MKSVKRKFQDVQKRHQFWSSYVCFAETVARSNYSKKAVYFWFNRLVDPDDYVASEKQSVLAHLVTLSKVPEEGIKTTLGSPTAALAMPNKESVNDKS